MSNDARKPKNSPGSTGGQYDTKPGGKGQDLPSLAEATQTPTKTNQRDANATTAYVPDFETIINPSATSFEDIVRTAAGDFQDDFDIENATKDYVDEINKITNPLGVSVTESGQAYCSNNADIDDDAITEGVNNIDIYEILQRHDKQEDENM